MPNPLLLGSPSSDGLGAVLVPLACAEGAAEPGCDVTVLVTDGDDVIGSTSTSIRPGEHTVLTVELAAPGRGRRWEVWVRATCLGDTWDAGPLGASVQLPRGRPA